ncbi:MAG: tRNA (adenosine(37)-N6)-threonylcarbamoyltransferase complex dimerization subunit type 1 TsaB [Silvibacterium sp.]
MMVLAIDTCGATGSIALGRVDAGEISILTLTELAGKTYSAQLVPAARAMLTEQSVEIGELEAVVVVNGPGSFTGVRIGVSSAKGLAEGLGVPLLAVSRLAVLAWKGGVEQAAFDAGRGEFYVRNGTREFLLPVKDMPLTEPNEIAVCEMSAQRAFSGAVPVEAPTAGDALRFAAPRLLAGDFADAATLDGNYVRRSDAEIFSRTGAKTAGKA